MKIQWKTEENRPLTDERPNIIIRITVAVLDIMLQQGLHVLIMCALLAWAHMLTWEHARREKTWHGACAIQQGLVPRCLDCIPWHGGVATTYMRYACQNGHHQHDLALIYSNTFQAHHVSDHANWHGNPW